MEREKRLATAGQDERAKSLIATLRGSGYECLAIEHAPSSAATVLPMPYSADGVMINGTCISCAGFFASLARGHIVLGGRFDGRAYMLAMKHGVRLFDYFTPECVQIGNAALTARGAIAMAGDELAGARVLVCGFGRIGRCLMQQLQGVAHATVSARKDTDLAWAQALGYDFVHTSHIHAAPYDIIFNTVPHLVFDRERLSSVKAGARLIDLASAPYGTDLAAAADLGVDVCTAPGLPGKMYPAEAGALLGASALKILEREGVG